MLEQIYLNTTPTLEIGTIFINQTPSCLLFLKNSTFRASTQIFNNWRHSLTIRSNNKKLQFKAAVKKTLNKHYFHSADQFLMCTVMYGDVPWNVCSAVHCTTVGISVLMTRYIRIRPTSASVPRSITRHSGDRFVTALSNPQCVRFVI